MVETVKNEFSPDYAVAPGEILVEELEFRGMSQAEFALRAGMAKKTINEIIKGKASITPETAIKLEHILNQPAQYWLNLETRYQSVLAEQREEDELAQQLEWLDTMPLQEMIRRKWVQNYENKVDQLRELLSFFGVASPNQWEAMWSDSATSFRKSYSFENSYAATSAWLRKGELEASQREYTPYDAIRFKDKLKSIRALTLLKDPTLFLEPLQNECAKAGVVVVVLKELPGMRVSGATRWIKKDLAVIQLSFRYKSDDHLWFTFFHEAAHILKHGKKETFLEVEGTTDPNSQPNPDHEAEADRFAAEFLIPRKAYAALTKSRRFSKTVVENFANNIGVSPGIVVGRLQHDGWIPHQNLNGLKSRFDWNDEATAISGT